MQYFLKFQLGLIAFAIFAFTSVDFARGEGRTIVEASFSYRHVRMRPTYDANVRASFSGTVLISGKNKIEMSAAGAAGRYQYASSSEGQIGQGAWRVVGPNRFSHVRDWPQSTSTMTITTTRTGCKFTFSERLKPGFTEYKLPMLSRHEFGYYGPRTITGTSCTIRNE